MKKYLTGILFTAMLIGGLFILTGCGNQENVSNASKEDSSSSSETPSSTSKDNKKPKIGDTEQEATVYWGTKDNFEEYSLVVDTTKQSKEIIKDLIAEIAKYADYDIEIKSVIDSSSTLAITFGDSFNPDEETANKIYDSIYQTCYKGFGITSDYFDLPNGEKVSRRIGD